MPDIYVNNRGGLYLKEPDPAKGEMTAAQKAYIDTWMDDVDTLLFDDARWLDPVDGWRKYIDEDAAIDFWIAAEITKGYGLNYRSSHSSHPDSGVVVVRDSASKSQVTAVDVPGRISEV